MSERTTVLRGITPERVRGQKLLVVDDEEAMRAAMRIILAAAGYNVLTARNPNEALVVLESNSDTRLIICDLVMPGMDLREFVRTSRALYPSVDIAFCSGFPKTRFDSMGIPLTEDHFIAKPFHPQELREKVAAIL